MPSYPLSATGYSDGGAALIASMATLASCVLPDVRSRTWGRPFLSQIAWSLVFLPPLAMPIPPFCASGGAVDLDTTAIDEQPGRHTLNPGEPSEDALPHTAPGPAPEPVVERLLRTVDRLRTVAPATAALQSMDDPGKNASVIDPWHPARILRQRPLLIRKPEEIRHSTCLLAGGL